VVVLSKATDYGYHPIVMIARYFPSNANSVVRLASDYSIPPNVPLNSAPGEPQQIDLKIKYVHRKHLLYVAPEMTLNYYTVDDDNLVALMQDGMFCSPKHGTMISH